MDAPQNDQPPMRTDDVARQLEYVTHAKWTTEEYKAVVSILRLYRHNSISAILDRIAGDVDDSGDRRTV